MSSQPYRLTLRFLLRTLTVQIFAGLASCSDGTGPVPGPTVTDHAPSDGAANVSTGTVVSVTFSDVMDPASFTAGTFTLTGPLGPVEGTVVASESTAVFTPASPLTDLAPYTAFVGTGVTDTAGHPLAASHSWTFTTAPLLKLIGDLEWSAGGCQATLPTANSIMVTLGVVAATYSNLVDTAGGATPVSFSFDSGGAGISSMICLSGWGALEKEGITGSGPVLIRPWHMAGLTPGRTYQMTFTGGGSGVGTLRIFADADGDGTIEPGEVEDLIGPNNLVETRVFGQPITADADGEIRGEFWGGSTNAASASGWWCAWTIVGAPGP